MLSNEKTVYNYFNFITIANHLKEWISNDDNLDDDIKKKADFLLEQSNHSLFKDLCNRSKHFKLTNKRKTKTEDRYVEGFNWSNFSWNNFTWEPSKYEVIQDGKEIDLFEECEKMYTVYSEIFNELK